MANSFNSNSFNLKVIEKNIAQVNKNTKPNRKIVCILDDDKLYSIDIGQYLKIYGIVSTKIDETTNNVLKNEKLYEKIIEVISLENLQGVFRLYKEIEQYISIHGETIFSNDIKKFDKLAKMECISTFLLYSIFDENIYQSFENYKVLLLYSIFSTDVDLNLSILDYTNNDNISNDLKSLSTFLDFNCFYYNFLIDTKSTEDLLTNKGKKSVLVGDIFVSPILHSQDNFLIIDDLQPSPNQNLTNVSILYSYFSI